MTAMGRAGAAGLWLATSAAVASAAGAAAVAHGSGLPQAGARVADAVVVTLFVVSGAVVLVHRPGHPIGLLLWAGGGLWGLSSLLLEVAAARLVAGADRPGWAVVAVVALAVRGAGWILVVVLLPLLFPDGRLPSARWRPAVALALGSLVLFTGAVLTAPEPLDYRLAGIRNPLGFPRDWRPAVDLLPLTGLALVVVSALVGLCAVTVRRRRGDPLVRQQVGALLVAATVSLVIGLWIVVDQSRSAIAFPLAVAAIPVAVGVAVLQHGLYDLRLAVNRTLVYGVLTAGVVAVYVVVVGGVGAVLRSGGPGWAPVVAAAVVAVAFQPVRERVQRTVNRLTLGVWDEPAEVVRRLGDRLADAAAPEHTLPAVVDALADSLRLPHVAVLGADGAVLASRGRRGEPEQQVPLVHERVEVGVLRLAGVHRGASTVPVLTALAHQLAPVVRALELSRQLQASRERLVLSREEERRRLRRDLHDGLGPALAGLTLRVDTARNTVGGDPAVDRVLLELRDDVQEAVADVRRVVEDLRPAALDDLGLPGALHALARRMSTGPLPVVVEACPTVPPLPAATEVAAYRIAQEAVTNAIRHAGPCATCVRVVLRAEAGPSLTVSVEDDGHGRDAALASPRPGNGLLTMREWAEELGGELVVTDRAGGGTVVRAALPTGASAGGPR
ncbi:Histidine kinase-, DNA gyrase B-, and HSP90-like ATPase [Blastococcus sp. DSM 46786]|uniref:sensor histidine kinase n=1 Tax=Blastococcus sp. DSM 46786 TaxID=1798227 RepID=UPI0008AC5B24|nr:sensor histidine kinase [Blastococcus sp. DSM 46786]SEK57033.1 Histidine kinase-, DNA gyrase B-, and HSP90-like ATPase [Blastococcus sp. DSM 46786]